MQKLVWSYAVIRGLCSISKNINIEYTKKLLGGGFSLWNSLIQNRADMSTFLMASPMLTRDNGLNNNTKAWSVVHHCKHPSMWRGGRPGQVTSMQNCHLQAVNPPPPKLPKIPRGQLLKP